jgi:hypothetical protein
MILQHEEVRLRPIVLPDDAGMAVHWYPDPEVLYSSEGGRNHTMPRRLFESRGFVVSKTYIDDEGHECLSMELVL